MKYTLRRSANNKYWNIHRYGEIHSPPDNAHIEFWNRIQELEAQLIEERDKRIKAENALRREGLNDPSL